MRDLRFAAEFPGADFSGWAALAVRAVGTSGGVEGLTTCTRDGLTIAPIYSQRHEGRTVEARHGRWQIFQRVDHPDPAMANALARRDLKGGADGLEIVFPGSAAAHGFGVGIDTLDDLDRVLEDIDLEKVPLRLDGGYEVRQAIAMTAALIERRGCDPAKVDVVAQSDPANGLFSNGRLVVPYDLTSDWGADMVKGLIARGLRLPVFVGEGRAVHAAGGTEAQELAYALSSGLEHLRMMEARGIGLEDAAATVTFTLAADADQFLTIAKLRAFRLAWARIVELVGLPDAPARLHVETAWRMMTRRDPWVNILRGTVAVAAAGLGGADSVLALPFTQAKGLPDEFARRVARNCQLVLLDEAGLATVADPASGSGYVEEMTQRLAEAAWELFRGVEREGGIIASLRKGAFQERVLETRRAREADAARRLTPIVGVSEYPWLAEVVPDTASAEPHEVQASGNPIPLPEPGEGQRFEGLVSAVRNGVSMADILATIGYEWERTQKAPWWRVAEPFERLRDASDKAYAATGRRASVFLANIGSQAEFAERAAFARHTLGAGGLDAIMGEGGTEPEEIARAYASTGTRAVCICPGVGHDAKIGDVARWVKAMGARHVLCVTEPGDTAARADSDIEIFLYEGCDILGVLEALHATLGLAGGAVMGCESA